MCEDQEDEQKEPIIKTLIKLDDDGYYFKEVAYNYIIAKAKTDKDGKLAYTNLVYYPTALSALRYYVLKCSSKRRNKTVEQLQRAFEKAMENISKVLGSLSDAKREYELRNEMLLEDIDVLQKRITSLENDKYGISKSDVSILKSSYSNLKRIHTKLKEKHENYVKEVEDAKG